MYSCFVILFFNKKAGVRMNHSERDLLCPYQVAALESDANYILWARSLPGHVVTRILTESPGQRGVLVTPHSPSGGSGPRMFVKFLGSLNSYLKVTHIEKFTIKGV